MKLKRWRLLGIFASAYVFLLMENILDAAEINAFFDSERASNGELDRFLLQVDRQVFEDERGNTERLTIAGIDTASLQVIYYLVCKLQASHTIETGFGHGLSAVAILLGKAGLADQKHMSIDHRGLPNGEGGVVQRHIESRFKDSFERIYEPSEIALPALLRKKPDMRIKFALIDGNHHLDGVMIDFYYLDRFCAIGGYLLIDDVRFPAVETLVNFIRSNKSNYRVQEIGRFAVLQKLDDDRRAWNHFRPFVVPNRRDWERRPDGVGYYLKRCQMKLKQRMGRLDR